MRALKLKKFAAAKVILVGLIVWSLTATATVMLYVDAARLVELSDVVVQGRVVDQNTFMDEKVGNVVTETTLEITRNFYGADEMSTIKISQWGGEYDGKISILPGDAKFNAYEDVIVFANRGVGGPHVGKFYLTALGQSKYTIHNDGNTITAIRDLRKIAFLEANNKYESRTTEVHNYREFAEQLELFIQMAKGGAQ